MIIVVDESRDLSSKMLECLTKKLISERKTEARKIEKVEITMLSQSSQVPVLRIKEEEQ